MEKKRLPEDDYAIDMLSKQNGVASATECTGMIQIPPENYDEAESYNEIYVVPKVLNERKKELEK